MLESPIYPPLRWAVSATMSLSRLVPAAAVAPAQILELTAAMAPILGLMVRHLLPPRLELRLVVAVLATALVAREEWVAPGQEVLARILILVATASTIQTAFLPLVPVVAPVLGRTVSAMGARQRCPMRAMVAVAVGVRTMEMLGTAQV
jgi:hypothetical protein